MQAVQYQAPPTSFFEHSQGVLRHTLKDVKTYPGQINIFGNNLDAELHQVVSKLIENGAQPHLINQKIYDTNSINRLRLLGTALKNLKKIDSTPVVYITLSQKELNQNKFKKGDTEGFVNYGLSLEGILLAVIMIENEVEKTIKMSFRSKGSFDVNKFAKKYFNGGVLKMCPN